MNLRPIDLPQLRVDTIDYVTKDVPAAYDRAITDGRQPLFPNARTSFEGGQIMAAAELIRLTEADLFYVSAEMTDLAVVAGSALPEFTLMPEDLPSEYGFIYFDKPIATVDYAEYHDNESASDIVAAAWGPWTGGNPHWIHGGLWVTFYADMRGVVDTAVQRGIIRELPAHARAQVPRLSIDNECMSPFSPDPLPAMVGGEQVDFSNDKGVGRWMAILKTTWLLMSQPVTTVTEATYDRAARRRLQKAGQEPPAVRVINLRRVTHTSGSGTSDREYHHQWIVRGHWRQHWYPARQVHRPVWIAPHVKGPDGAPLLGGEKVHAWTR